MAINQATDPCISPNPIDVLLHIDPLYHAVYSLGLRELSSTLSIMKHRKLPSNLYTWNRVLALDIGC